MDRANRASGRPRPVLNRQASQRRCPSTRPKLRRPCTAYRKARFRPRGRAQRFMTSSIDVSFRAFLALPWTISLSFTAETSSVSLRMFTASGRPVRNVDTPRRTPLDGNRRQRAHRAGSVRIETFLGCGSSTFALGRESRYRFTRGGQAMANVPARSRQSYPWRAGLP